MRPFRFGGGLFSAGSPGEWADGARRLESAGYDTLWTGDHFSPTFLAPVPALLAAVMTTTILRVSCTVFANDFRYPAALAKEIATADMLSGGRFEFGIGARSNKLSDDRAGVAFDSPGVRVARLEEAVRILKVYGQMAPSISPESTMRFETMTASRNPPSAHTHRSSSAAAAGDCSHSPHGEADLVGVGARAKPTGDGLDAAEETHAWVAQKIEWLREAAPDRFDELELA